MRLTNCFHAEYLPELPGEFDEIEASIARIVKFFSGGYQAEHLEKAPLTKIFRLAAEADKIAQEQKQEIERQTRK